MAGILDWLRVHKYGAQIVAALLMALPPAFLYFAAQQGATGWIWALLSLVILGNVLVLLVR